MLDYDGCVLNGLTEGWGVGVVADKAAVVDNDAVDGSDGFCFRTQLVEQRDNGLLEGYGDVESVDLLIGDPLAQGVKRLHLVQGVAVVGQSEAQEELLEVAL